MAKPSPLANPKGPIWESTPIDGGLFSYTRLDRYSPRMLSPVLTMFGELER